jgi:hypothetical protein
MRSLAWCGTIHAKMLQIAADDIGPGHPCSPTRTLNRLELLRIARQAHRVQPVTTGTTRQDCSPGAITEEERGVMTFWIRNPGQELGRDHDHVLRRAATDEGPADFEAIKPA